MISALSFGRTIYKTGFTRLQCENNIDSQITFRTKEEKILIDDDVVCLVG
jgi:hypothetical protein